MFMNKLDFHFGQVRHLVKLSHYLKNFKKIDNLLITV